MTLTAEVIDAMEAGQEIDMLIANQVMERDLTWWVDEARPMLLKYYSTDIAAAWEVVDAMTGRGYSVAMQILSPKEPQLVRIYKIGGKYIGNSYALTAPLAICRAALKATEA